MQADQDPQVALHVVFDADVVVDDLDGDALVAREALLVRGGGAPLAGVPPLVAPRCYKSIRYTRQHLRVAPHVLE